MKGREVLSETRQWLLTEFGLDVDEDDQILIAAAAARAGLDRGAASLEEATKRAVERASDPLRENMQKQIGILEGIANNFEQAAGEGRQMADARTALVSIMQEMSNETKPLVSDMALTRRMLERNANARQSPALLAVAGFAILVSGIAIGLTVSQAML